MKRFIVLVIIFTYLSIPCFSQIGRNTEREKRKGYSELKIYKYSYKNGKIDIESKKLYELVMFDNNGDIVFSKYFDYDNIDDYILRKYNSKGDAVSSVVYKDNKPTEDTTIIINIYNSKNQLKKVIVIMTIYIQINTYTYNEDEEPNSIVSTIQSIDEDSTLLSYLRVYTYKYNDKGQVLEKILSHTPGGPNEEFHDWNARIYIFKYKYSNKGLVIEETNYDKYGKPEYTLIYEYN